MSLLRRAGMAGMALLAWGSAAGQASASVVTTATEQAPAAVREYWTSARMRAATPVELRAGSSRAAPFAGSPRRADDVSESSASFPGRLHGKVFFTLVEGSAPGDFVCSATVVRSNSRSLVWTAGHCLDDAETGGGIASNWVFVPGYRAGSAPFGEWPAKRLATTSGWHSSANVRVDLGAATLFRDALGRGLEDVVGARPIGFGRPRLDPVTAFGYPAEPTLFQPLFDGERLYSCASEITGSDNPAGGGPNPLQIECDMSGGSSGGGWVTADGTVTGLTSYGYPTDFDHLYGPYFGAAARELYEKESGPPIVCGGARVTNLGGPGANVFTGDAEANVFRLGGGSDRASGAGGDDAICGGGGDDRLIGGPGADVLIGGPGVDTCIGGPGRDRVRGCERGRY